MNKQVKLDRYQLEASVCKEEFYEFVKRFWSVVEPATPVWNWHIEILCKELQEAAERVFRKEPRPYDLIINVPPGTTKSLVCSIMFPAWIWCRSPSSKVLSTSFAHALAVSMSRKSRMIVESKKWTQLFGAIRLSEDQNAKGHYENERLGLRLVSGTDGVVVGRHADFIIIDDPIDPLSAISVPLLATTNLFITETLATRKTDKAVTLTILIMQRLHQNDPTGLLLRESESADGTPIRHICLPGEINYGTRLKEVKPKKYAANYTFDEKGQGLLDPRRLNRLELRRLRNRLKEYGYAGQILQRPVPAGGGMFKWERVTIDEAPSEEQFNNLCRYWDKAGTKDGGAYTVGAQLGVDRKGRYWILDIERGQWEASHREEILLANARIDGVKTLIGLEQEPGSGGKESMQATVKNLAGFRVRVDKVTGDKVIRADPFAVQVNSGNVYMRRAPWNKELIEEMKFFPFSTNKDQIDACGGAFAILSAGNIKVGGAWSVEPQ